MITRNDATASVGGPQHTVVAPSSQLLVADGISKRYGGVAALSGVDLTLAKGERLAIVGENGAGKSTLMGVLAGLVTPDEGSVKINGQDVTGSPDASRRAGVALVHQERSLVPHLSVAENVTLGASPTRAGFLLRRQQQRDALSTLGRLGIENLDALEAVVKLSAAQQTFVEIAKALHQNPAILILDEPSAMLTPRETTQLIDLTRRLSEQGMAIVYISHRLPEIYAFCDHVFVLRDGRTVGEFPLEELDTDQLITKMAGQALKKDLRQERKASRGEIVLTAEGLTTDRINKVDIKVHAGEVVGVGGLVGSGRTELLRAIVGLDPRRSGRVQLVLDGRSRAVTSFTQAVRHGIAFVPEERRTDGVILSFGVGENLLLPMISRGWQLAAMSPSTVRQRSSELMQRLKVVAPNAAVSVGSLSGGNQQKIAFGKWLSVAPKLLILDEPTRGVDVGAKAEIHRLIRSWADEGMAVLFVSSDMPELLALADRVEVMRDGVLVGSVDHRDADEETILALAAGRHGEVGRRES